MMAKKNSKKKAKKKTAKKVDSTKSIEEGKICAILAYLFPIGLIWFLVDEKLKKNAFAKFHVQQSIVLFIASLALWVIAGILSMMQLGFIIRLVYLVLLIFVIIQMVAASQGQKKELPFIGEYGKKINL